MSRKGRSSGGGKPKNTVIPDKGVPVERFPPPAQPPLTREDVISDPNHPNYRETPLAPDKKY
jgi:hypothetical protein